MTVPPATHRVRRPGVRCHTADRETTLHASGLTVTTLGSTWCDFAAHLSVLEVVQVGDAIVNRDGWDLPEPEFNVELYDEEGGRAALIGDARYDVVVITDDDLRRADEVRRRLARLLRRRRRQVGMRALDRTPSPHAQVGSSYACSGP